MHLAICLWGVMRSASFIIQSYQQYVIEPILQAGHTYDTFIHTYEVGHKYQNVRNNEKPTMLNTTEYLLFKPTYIYVENQTDFLRRTPYMLFASQGDPWKNNYVSFQNYLCALNSLNHITNVVKSMSQHIHYDGIIFVRPDVLYLSPIPINLLQLYPKNYVFTPDFHRACIGNEVNDRFAMASLPTGLIIGSRYQYALNYSLSYILNAEKYLKHYLEASKVHVMEIPFRFRRIRTSGAIDRRDINIDTVPNERINLEKEKDKNKKENEKKKSENSWFSSMFTSKQKEEPMNNKNKKKEKSYYQLLHDTTMTVCHPRDYLEYDQMINTLKNISSVTSSSGERNSTTQQRHRKIECTYHKALYGLKDHQTSHHAAIIHEDAHRMQSERNYGPKLIVPHNCRYV